ncbi:four helix bundle protein [Idiomarina baltica]|uniref:Four helix bundle protein n=1 Tax=Idiomarina baltica OS145 TaxID=314276 RepID=A0ABM9WLP8_9GAMM|nr:four helix bundle protein [Idiomarina baltica]EAQ31838.1 hypothetical protein OS145_11047 [Idiomarina baltica OS145]
MNYQKLWLWQHSLDIAIDIMETFQHSKNFSFKDQVFRSAISIPSNIAEAMTRDTPADRRRILYYAIGSCAELDTQLQIALRLKWIETKQREQWRRALRQIYVGLHRLRGKLEQSRDASSARRL